MSLQRTLRRRFLYALGGFACAAAVPAFGTDSRLAAVLIGVSRFDHLKIEPLAGPVNDVALMRQALRRNGYRDSDIVQLTDGQIAARHPTGFNILRALRDQAKRLQSGDRVVVYFSGHGAQAPQNLARRTSSYLEPDGLDEVFLTRDTRYWNPEAQRVEGALLDDEIGLALAAFTKKGVHVWSIFDTCHAGDMVRNTSGKRSTASWRGVNATLLGVPPTKLLGSGGPQIVAASARAESDGQLVTFYAAASDESTPEESFAVPADANSSTSATEYKRYGVFTWSIANAMTASHTTYAELANAVLGTYANRPFPTPSFTGPLNSGLPYIPKTPAFTRRRGTKQ